MPTCKYAVLEKVLRKMGFDEHQMKKGSAWVGVSPINDELVQIVLHIQTKGRDIPDGLFIDYYKKLGFRTAQEFHQWIQDNL